MKPSTRACFTLLAALVALAPAAQAIQTCTQKFSDLKVCTMLNGLLATGDATRLDATKMIEVRINEGYDKLTAFRKNDECKDLRTTFGCVTALSLPDSTGAAPCSSKGQPLKICKALCIKYFKSCITDTTDAQIEAQCTNQAAPAGDECFGDAGVLGMKSAANTSIPPIFAVAFLSLAAYLGM